MVAPSIVRDRTPNFPTPPVKNIQSLSMPNDLVADGRNFYTEIFFLDYRTAAYAGTAFAPIAEQLNQGLDAGGNLGPVAGSLAGAAAGAGAAGLVAGPVGIGVGALLGGFAGLVAGTGNGFAQTASIRLPIPRSINDMITLSWEPLSATQLMGGLLPAGLSQAIGKAGQAAGALVGKALNPLLFIAFNHQNFREFTFEWVLAPATKKESQTIKEIVTIIKNASLPTKNIIMDYPLIAMVNMSPNNINGMVKFKPMAVMGVSVNYTPNPTGPSFFEGDEGAPTMVTLTVKFQEIKLWYRGEIT
jgi:hypothetical protein